MQNLIWLVRVLGFVCLSTVLLSCSATNATKPKQNVEHNQTDAGWQSLFNGNDLDAWQQLGGKAEYEIVDGTIVGTSKLNTPNSFLTTKKLYQNFILEFEFNVDDGLNSGLQFRSNSKADYKNGRVHGYQFEFDTSARSFTAGIYDEARRGWLYTGDYSPKTLSNFKHELWNKGRIECYENEVRTYLNGELVSHLIDLPSIEQKGFIGLQVHSIRNKDVVGKQVRWKNIRIKEIDKPLPAATDKRHFVRNLMPNSLSEFERYAGWQLMFDGEKSEAFVSPKTGRFPEKGWQISDGAMTVTKSVGSKVGGDIVTKKEYSAFDLQLEFKLTEKSNSGVKYYFTNYFDQERNKERKLGLEYQILDNQNHPDAKRGRNLNRTLASLYDILPAEQKVYGRSIKAPVGKWNFARIVAKKNGNVEHWLNGFKVLEYRRLHDNFKHYVSLSKYKNIKNFGQAKSGKILLQDHYDEVSYRNIKIREL